MPRSRNRDESYKAYKYRLKMNAFKLRRYLLGTVIWPAQWGTYIKSLHGPIGIDAERGR